MRSVVLLCLVACGGDAPRPNLDGPYACGSMSCASGQICLTVESGSQCQVNYDAGIGQYQIYSWSCIDLPNECDGIPSCDCINGPGICLGVSEGSREIAFGCI